MHQSLKQTFNNNLTLRVILLIAVFSLLYWAGIHSFVPTGETTERNWIESILLVFILIGIFAQLKHPTSAFRKVYWLLLAAAILPLLAINFVKLSFWDDVSIQFQIELNSLAHFLFYSFVIAAIEIHHYRTANQLLNNQSLLVWFSTLTFTLAAFVFLVLVSSRGAAINANHLPSESIFYLLMNAYILLRWIHLSWEKRSNSPYHYLLMGLAAFSWIIVDLVNALSITERISGSIVDYFKWFSVLPLLFTFIAIQLANTATKTPSDLNNDSVEFSSSRIHILNSPLLFLISFWLLATLLSSNPSWFTPLNQLQHQVLNIWLTLCCVLSIIQWFFGQAEIKRKFQQLSEAKIASAVMQQRMIQQSQVLEDQIASNREILDTTDNAILTLDSNGKILSCNPAACILLEHQREELIDTLFTESVQAEGELNRYFSYQSYRQKVARNVRGIEIESVITSASGARFPVHVTLSSQKNNKDGLIVISLVNISEQKRAEIEAHELKDQFTANISHEFRTPLTLINGVLDNLIAQPLFASEKDALATAKRNGMRMIRLVEQLLDLSRIANDPLPVNSIDAHPVIQFVCNSFIDIAKNKKLQFRFELAEKAWIKGNQTALEKVLFNLLSNAFKYTELGEINVVLHNINNHWVLTVSDTGIGIGETDQIKVFERFKRIDNSATQTNHGVGIGLALVKELCQSMNWQIELKSQINQGSVFTLQMSLAHTADSKSVDLETLNTMSFDDTQTILNVQQSSIGEHIASEIVDSQVLPSPSPSYKSKHSVLIIEDNNDMREHINKVLSPFHQCLLAHNGEEGFRLAMDYIPDIIISDIMMPGISGFEVLKLIKTTAMTNHIPVILLTARGDTASKIRGLQAAADDYLSKPFDANELCLRVNNQLSSRAKLQQKLAVQWQNFPEELSQPELIEDKFIQKLEELFEGNFQSTDFSMLELANTLAMSDRQVQRKVKALLGVSPLDALKKFRLKKAKVLLEGNQQIGFVAQTCGFSSQSYFGRCFKEQYAVTPKQFQQSLQSD